MLYIIIAVFGFGVCLSWLMLNRAFAGQIKLQTRLYDIGANNVTQGKSGINEELQADFGERVVRPLLNAISALTQKYTPIKQLGAIEKKLDYAGRPFGWNANDYVSVQYAATFGLGILVFIISSLYGASSSNRIMASLTGLIVGYLLVELMLKNKIKKRQNQIEKELPDVLDLLTISIEAGLGFDAAMQRVVQKSKGPISEEFNQTLQEMRIGKTRKESFRDMSLRVEVGDLCKLVDAIVQADQLGVSLGNVLRNQSDQTRLNRRQRVEEKAMKAPVKMLIPMVIFIFPTIFIVILAPAILNMVNAFR
jgi:tight adherence protein C